MKCLRDFPEEFLPLTIITGDRREQPPKSKGDVLAYSVSSTDVMYLTHLNLHDSPVLSDKQFVIDAEDALRKRFGSTNLLVIGSPAVNLLARRINNQFVFRFSISEDTQLALKEQNEFIDRFVHTEDDFFIYQHCLDGIVDPTSIVERFVGLKPNIEELHGRAEKISAEFAKSRICHDLQAHPRPIRYLLHQLDKPGIFDGLTSVNRGESIGAYKDYGLISVGENPFSEGGTYSVVYVAGVHGPGTAEGVKLLSRKKSFEDHPFGGVFEVSIGRFASYFEKIQMSYWSWETKAFSVAAYTSAKQRCHRPLKAFLSSPGKKRDKVQRSFNKALCDLLRTLFREKGHTLHIEDPYTIDLAGRRLNFWQAILDYEKASDFVLHDMTGCARGVMVEIGFSYGTRTKHFLIWNSDVAPLDRPKEEIPSLFPTENVESISMSEPAETRELLEKKVVEKTLQGISDYDCLECEPLRRAGKKRTCLLYTSEPELEGFLAGELSKRGVHRAVEAEFGKELRICKICQALQCVDLVVVELAEQDMNSFVVLGMAKALEKRTLPLALARYSTSDFPWANEIISYQLENLGMLGKEVSKFYQYGKDEGRTSASSPRRGRRG